jgi:hypothetical protein
MPASVPQAVQRLRAAVSPQGQATQAEPAQLWSPTNGTAAPAGLDGVLELAMPTAAPATATAELQRDAADDTSVAPSEAPVIAQPAPVVAQPAPVVAQPVPEVQRQEAAAPAAAASEPPTATVSSGADSTAAGAGTTPQTEEELDVLAGRLYDHIALRLRRELRMDRERTGLLTDLT